MAIDPLGSSGIPEAGAKRAGGVPQSEQDTAATRSAAKTAAADSVEVSAEARELAAPDIPAGSLDADRLREITGRLADGTYNGREAIDAIARGIER